MKRLVFFYFLIILLSMICTDAYCLNVSPGRIEISVAASKKYEDVLIVRNTEKRDLEIKLKLEDWFKQSSPFNWLEIRPLEFGLKEGEAKEVRFQVTIPKGTKGELNGMIFVEAKPKQTTEGSIGINTSIGIPIYVMIRGTEYFKAEVEDLKVVRWSPLALAITIKNSGNVHIRPTGTIEIKKTDSDGLKERIQTDNPRKSALTLPLNEYNYPVLPNSSRTLEIRSDNRLEQGEYVADIKMGYGDRKKYRKKVILKIQNERG